MIPPLSGPWTGEITFEKYQQVGQSVCAGDFLVYCSHGVAEYSAWETAFKEADETGFHKDLGVKKSWVGRSVNPSSYFKQSCEVIHTFPRDSVAKVAAALDFTKPPFVGGPDLIRKGVVQLPARKVIARIAQVNDYDDGCLAGCRKLVGKICGS